MRKSLIALALLVPLSGCPDQQSENVPQPAPVTSQVSAGNDLEKPLYVEIYHVDGKITSHDDNYTEAIEALNTLNQFQPERTLRDYNREHGTNHQLVTLLETKPTPYTPEMEERLDELGNRSGHHHEFSLRLEGKMVTGVEIDIQLPGAGDSQEFDLLKEAVYGE